MQALLPSPPQEVCPRQTCVRPTNRKESEHCTIRALSLLERNQRLRVCRRSCRALLTRSAQGRHAYDQQIGKSRSRCPLSLPDALAEPSSRGLPKTDMRTTNKPERVGAVARCRCLKEISDSACAGALVEPFSRGLPKTDMRTTNKSERVGAVAQFVRCRCLKEIGDSVCAGTLAETSSRGLPKTGMRTTNKSERVGAVARFVRCRCLKEISDSANSARFRASSLLAKTIVADVLPQCACK